MYGYGDVESGRGPACASQFVHLALERDRKSFVRKVYSIVAVQLLGTAIIGAPIATASKYWLQAHAALFTVSTFGFLAMGVVLACCGAHLMRQHPTNLLILAGFTVLEAISLGFVCSMYEVTSVLWCLGATGAIAGALTLFAVTTDVDVTGMGGFLSATSLGLFLLGLLGMFTGAHMLQMLYAMGGAVLFSGYIVYDTQLIVGGKSQGERQFSLDDYAFAALSIYMDLVQLFMFLLRLLGEERRR